jgi:hypothetical protein
MRTHILLRVAAAYNTGSQIDHRYKLTEFSWKFYGVALIVIARWEWQTKIGFFFRANREWLPDDLEPFPFRMRNQGENRICLKLSSCSFSNKENNFTLFLQ